MFLIWRSWSESYKIRPANLIDIQDAGAVKKRLETGERIKIKRRVAQHQTAAPAEDRQLLALPLRSEFRDRVRFVVDENIVQCQPYNHNTRLQNLRFLSQKMMVVA